MEWIRLNERRTITHLESASRTTPEMIILWMTRVIRKHQFPFGQIIINTSNDAFQYKRSAVASILIPRDPDGFPLGPLSVNHRTGCTKEPFHFLFLGK